MAEEFCVGDKVRVANRIDGVIVLLSCDQASAVIEIPCESGHSVVSALLSQLKKVESRQPAVVSAASA